MSLLPGTILPQDVPFGRVNANGSVTIEKNWWLLIYNLCTQTLGTSAGAPTDTTQYIDNSGSPDSAVLGTQLSSATALLLDADPVPTPTIRSVQDALLMAFNALDSADAAALAAASQVPMGANPTAEVGLATINGVATTFMRSDAAPALSQAITPTWSGAHQFDNQVGITFAAGANALQVAAGAGAVQMSINSNNAANSDADLYINRSTTTANTVAAGSNIQYQDRGASTASIFQHAGGQSELWQYNGAWAQIFKVLSTQSTVFNHPVGVNGVTPPAQATGFGTPTGQAIVTNFPGASATLAQCSSTLAELILIFKSIGFLGA